MECGRSAVSGQRSAGFSWFISGAGRCRHLLRCSDLTAEKNGDFFDGAGDPCHYCRYYMGGCRGTMVRFFRNQNGDVVSGGVCRRVDIVSGGRFLCLVSSEKSGSAKVASGRMFSEFRNGCQSVRERILRRNVREGIIVRV